MSDDEVTPRSKEMELLKSILDSKSQSSISQSSLSSAESLTQISTSASSTEKNSKYETRSDSPKSDSPRTESPLLSSSSSSVDSKQNKSNDASPDSDVSSDSKSRSTDKQRDSYSDDYSSDSSDTVVLGDSAKSKKSNRQKNKKHSSSDADSKSESDLDDKPNNKSRVLDDNDRYLTQRNRKFYSIEETEAKLYEDSKHESNQDRPKSANVLYIENHDEHYEKFKSNRQRRSQRPMSASSRLSSSESYDTPQIRPRRKLRPHTPKKQVIYNAWEESVNEKLCQKYGELKNLLLHSLDIMQSIPNKNELLYDQKYKAAKKIIKKTLYVPNTVSMSPRDVPSYFRKSAKGPSLDSMRNSNSIYRNDSESPRSDASYSSNYDNESVVSSNSHYSRVSASTDTSTLRGSKRVTFADDGGSLCSFDQSVTSDTESHIRGILKHKNKSNRRNLPHRESGHFTPQERSHRSRRKQLSMDDNSMIRSVSEEQLNRSYHTRITHSQSEQNLDNIDNSQSGSTNFGNLTRKTSPIPNRNKSPSRSVSLTSLNSSFDGSDYQLKSTDNPAVKKWLREKNKEHKRQIKQERLQKLNEQKLVDDQKKDKDIRTLESQIQFHKWLTNKQKELRIQKRHEKIKPKLVDIVTPPKNTSPSGLRPAYSYSGFAPKAPYAKKSGLPKRSASMKKKKKEQEKAKSPEDNLKKRISYENWLKQKQEDEAKERQSAEKLHEKLAKSADEDTKRVIADAARRRFERVVDGKKTLDSGIRKSAEETRPTSATPPQGTSDEKYKWANESRKTPERPQSARPQSPNRADRVSTSSQNPFKIPTPPAEGKKPNSRRNKNSAMYYKPRDFNNFLYEDASGERPEPQGCDAPNDLPAHETGSETSTSTGESKTQEKSKRKKSKSDSGTDTSTEIKPLAIKAKPDLTFLTSIET